MTFLRRDLRPIAARRQWAAEAVAGLSGSIKPPNEAGVALSVYGDAGWGRDVSRARRGVAPLGRGLLLATASTIRDRWRPEPAPEWVTSVPSAARAAGARLRQWPWPRSSGCRTSTRSSRPAASRSTSWRTASSSSGTWPGSWPLAAAVACRPARCCSSTTSWISGWTLTWAGSLLRAAGSGTVHPFALASAGGGDG